MLRRIKKNRWLKQQNMLDLVPIRKVAFTYTPDNRISLIVKRFPVRWLHKLLGCSEHIYFTLDAKGSLIWQLIDGTKPIAHICDEARSTPVFENNEMIEERISAFLITLYRHNLIDFQYE